MASAINIPFYFFKNIHTQRALRQIHKLYHLLSLGGGCMNVILTCVYLNYVKMSKTFFKRTHAATEE